MSFLNHWSPCAHPEWLTQQGQYSFFAGFDPARLPPTIRQVQQAIAQPYLPPIPEQELHLTLLGICSTDAITAAQWGDLRQAAATVVATFPAMEVELAPPTVCDEGVWCQVVNAPQLLRLRAALYAAAESVVGPGRLLAGSAFHPHLALAYATAAADQTPVQQALVPFRAKPLGSLWLTSVNLVTLTRRHQHYLPELLEEYSLHPTFAKPQRGST